MHIAQLSVAGEGDSRPQNHNSLGGPADQQALDEYACDRSNLPWVIFRAAHRASHLSALPARARAVLAALARTVDANRPFAAIFARRELLTGRALQSMRTFYRSLEDLEVAGFITRPPQTRYGSAGLFGRAYLYLTAKAADVLGLTESSQQATDSLHKSEGAPARNTTAPFLTAPSVTLADGAIYKDLSPTNQKRQPGRLPADLMRLQLLGFRDFLIFKLMAEARRHGKLLSDVVETTWEHLKRARHPISYLRALLQKPVDYAYRVRTIRAESAEQETRASNDLHVQQATKAIAGKVFASRDGLTRYVVSANAIELTAHHRHEARPRVRVGSWAREFIAALDAGHIVPTTVSAANVAAASPRCAPAEQCESAATRHASRSKEQVDALKQMLKLKTVGLALRSNGSEKSKTLRAKGHATLRPMLSDLSPERADLLKNLLRRNKP
ncbi:replication protein O [Caballeronia sp. GAFFF1]|uniref:replication protein O n=1 Tax=Caballeronia sp. GAFFF1 TaxID=2921779 RepID=UPI002028E9A5|nr:replication protein O [Caballeronia sp. GAFFF1]